MLNESDEDVMYGTGSMTSNGSVTSGGSQRLLPNRNNFMTKFDADSD